MRRHKNHLHQTRQHLVAAFGIIIVPLLLLLIFAGSSLQFTSTFVTSSIVSLLRLAVAYILSVGLAWGAAIAFYYGRRAAVALPIFDVLQSFPAFAALPLAVHFLGSSNAIVILFLVIAIIWPIFFSTISTLKLVKKDWQEAVTIACLAPTTYLTHFLLPVSVPAVITGSIIGLGEGWEALVATEIITNAKGGVGQFFQSLAGQPVPITLGILGLLVIIFGLNKIIWLPLLEWSHHRMEE